MAGIVVSFLALNLGNRSILSVSYWISCVVTKRRWFDCAVGFCTLPSAMLFVVVWMIKLVMFFVGLAAFQLREIAIFEWSRRLK